MRGEAEAEARLLLPLARLLAALGLHGAPCSVSAAGWKGEDESAETGTGRGESKRTGETGGLDPGPDWRKRNKRCEVDWRREAIGKARLAGE